MSLRQWLCKPLAEEVGRLKEELEALRWQPPDVATLELSGTELRGRLAPHRVKLLDLEYDVPSSREVWDSLWRWGLRHLTPRYQAPNEGIDCEDLARDAVTFAKRANGKLTIGYVEGRTSAGVPHAFNIVVWTDWSGFLDFCPRALFGNPPPEGVFELPAGWSVEEVAI